MRPEFDLIDSQSDIEKCLSCQKNVCNNCVSFTKKQNKVKIKIDVETLAKMSETMSDSQIAKVFGCSNGTIRRRRLANDINKKPLRVSPIELNSRELVLKLLEEGHTDQFVAEKVGCSQTFVTRYRNSLNIPSAREKRREDHAKRV